VARQDYNKAVEDFNLRVKRFPGNIMAGLFNFTEKAYYEADKGSEKAPDIKFNIQ
jgi:LemA protein